MKTKELKHQVQMLKARAQAIVDQSNERKEPKTFLGNIKHMLDVIFTCADRDELWLPYEDNTCYMVSSEGRIKSVKFDKEIILQPFNTGQGYMAVHLWQGGERVIKKVHRMVAETFIYNDDTTKQVHHIDENKSNNTLQNLAWVTARENITASRKKDCSSKYLGVTWVTKRNKWHAKCFYQNKTNHIGYFEDELEAAEAYQDFLKRNNIENKYATL